MQKIEQDVVELDKRVGVLEYEVQGNGNPGLIDRMEVVETTYVTKKIFDDAHNKLLKAINERKMKPIEWVKVLSPLIVAILAVLYKGGIS